MALADRYRDLKVGEGTAQTRKALRAALTEALKNKRDLYTSQERVQNSPESVHIAQPTAMPFVPWSKEAEMLEAWTNKTAADTEILARGRFHAFKGEDGEPDDWEWFEVGTECEDGCVDAVIVRADSIQAAQLVALPSEISQEAADAIAAMMKEYNYPCNPANAARAAWRAARLYTAALPVREPCKSLCELCVKRGHSGCANTAQTTPIVVAQPVRLPLTDEQIETLRDRTFSINNPFCPVDSKSMRKTVRAVERAHGIGDKT
jgi:hypothetical protein